VAGTTHAVNSVADGLRLPLDFALSPRMAAVPLPEVGEVAPEVKAVFDEIMTFYAMDHVPAVYRWMARDGGHEPLPS